jgi:hypothetical protein
MRKTTSKAPKVNSPKSSKNGNGQTPKAPKNSADKGSSSGSDFQRQSRQISRQVPEIDVAGEEGAFGTTPTRGFVATDADERSDARRPSGHIASSSDDAVRDQGEFDEDGGGPRQSETVSGRASDETPSDEELHLQAETGAGNEASQSTQGKSRSARRHSR